MTRLLERLLELVEKNFELRLVNKNVDLDLDFVKADKGDQRDNVEEYFLNDATPSVSFEKDFSWSTEAAALYRELEATRNFYLKRLSPQNASNPVSLNDVSLYSVARLWHPNRRKKNSLWATRDLTVSPGLIFAKFKTLRLPDMGITALDSDLDEKLHELTDLSLAGNSITGFAGVKLPEKLRSLDLGTNALSQFPSFESWPALQHLSVAYNRIDSLTPALANSLAKDLYSLNLSFNRIVDLDGTLELLRPLTKLSILSLQGNLICLLPNYRVKTVSALQSLTYLDDLAVSFSEKYAPVETGSCSITPTCRIEFKVVSGSLALEPVLHGPNSTKALTSLSESLSSSVDRSESREEYEGVVELSLPTAAPKGSSLNLSSVPIYQSHPFPVDANSTTFIPILAQCEYQMPTLSVETRQSLSDGLVVSLSLKRFRCEAVSNEAAVEPVHTAAALPSSTTASQKKEMAAPKGKKGATSLSSGAAATGKLATAATPSPLPKQQDATEATLSPGEATPSEPLPPGYKLMTPIPMSDVQNSADPIVQAAYLQKTAGASSSGANAQAVPSLPGVSVAADFTTQVPSKATKQAVSTAKVTGNVGKGENRTPALEVQETPPQQVLRRVLESQWELARGHMSLHSFLTGKVSSRQESVALYLLSATVNPEYLCPTLLKEFQKVGDLTIGVTLKT